MGSPLLTQSAVVALVEYKRWADELTFEAVARLPEGEVRKERATLFRSIIGTLNHSYVVDLIWRAHLEGRDHGFSSRRVMVHEDVGTLRKAQAECNDWLREWCRAQSDASLNEPVGFRLISGEEGRMSRGAMVMHIVNHATYHRGYVDDLFYQIPAEPPTTDLCVYQGWRATLSD
jgi:uncharacterized damage-inducible protein DinB